MDRSGEARRTLSCRPVACSAVTGSTHSNARAGREGGLPGKSNAYRMAAASAAAFAAGSARTSIAARTTGQKSHTVGDSATRPSEAARPA